MLLKLGEPLTFTNFRVTGGKPKPEVKWYKDDAEIPAGAPWSATAVDAGTYKVVAENVFGSDVHYAYVKGNTGDYFKQPTQLNTTSLMPL